MKFFKKKEMDDIDEEMVLDLDEFDELEEEDAKKKELTLDEYEKNFIFHIDRGCPICRGDVKGNDHYKYFCKRCNILFDKQDIMEKDFGRHGDEKMKVHVVPLTEEQKETLQEQKVALMERIEKVFGEDMPPVQAEEGEVEEELGVEIPEHEPEGEPEPEVQEAEIVEEEPEPEEVEEPEPVEEVEEPESEPEEENVEEVEEPEYELEDEGKIIASSESTKIHKGTCHFIKKIHPENRKYFDTIENGEEEGYELCVCLRRLIAQRKAEERGVPELDMSDEEVDIHEELPEEQHEEHEETEESESVEDDAEEELVEVVEDGEEVEYVEEGDAEESDEEDHDHEDEKEEEENDETPRGVEHLLE